MIVRAKTKTLFSGRPLTAAQRKNSDLNILETEAGKTVLASFPRRIVLELTNGCNLNCTMCGRRAAEFNAAFLEMDWFYALEPLFDSVEEVTLMGWGEPTIHPHFVEMLQTIHRHSARKYFCTNGMRLHLLTKAIFENEVDVFAVSADGASPETNNRIRVGSDLGRINGSLRDIVRIKRAENLKYPHINYVFCAMKSNLNELPQMVEMTADVGLEELKVVYLTVFQESMAHESLWDRQGEVEEVFGRAARRAAELGVLLQLPYIQGKDPAGDLLHRECFAPHRDFFLGADGYTRPCMSTSDTFYRFDPHQNFMDLWNGETYQSHRETVNRAGMCQSCRNCFQASHCNWNRRGSYVQTGKKFAPDWGN